VTRSTRVTRRTRVTRLTCPHPLDQRHPPHLWNAILGNPR
jgi:hypothetical protein